MHSFDRWALTPKDTPGHLALMQDTGGGAEPKSFSRGEAWSMVHCLVLSREWANGLWRLLLGII